MKKLVAILVAFVLATSFSVVSLAAQSPTGETKYTVTVSSNVGGSNKANYKMVRNSNGTVTLTAVNTTAAFLKWEVVSGNYELVSGSLTSKKIVVRPLSDLKIKLHYKSEKADKPVVKPTDPSNKSPKTGNNIPVVAVGILAVAALGVTVIGKKS